MFMKIYPIGEKGQSTLEYAILIVIVAAALISIQTYINRGLQGRMRQATDDIGDQYSAGKTTVFRNTYTNSVRTETFSAGAQTTTTNSEFTNETYNSEINDYIEDWHSDLD